ncbi:MAG: cell wall anchor protein [Anaerolineae bacterium]
MGRKWIVLAITLVLVLSSVGPVFAAVDIASALAYLQTQQNEDGGFGSGFSPGSSLISTADVVLAIVAVGGDPATFKKGDQSPLTYLAAQAPSAATAGDLAKLILAVVAVGKDPRTFGGVDAVAKLEKMIGAGGRIGGEQDTFVSHLYAVLALVGAGRPVPALAVNLIKEAQQENGGWAWDGSLTTPVDTNTTAFAIQALIAAGESARSEAVTRALGYYKGIQNDDGGWPYQNPSDYGTLTDTNSTAVTIQALLAAGQQVSGADWTTSAGQNPLSALEALQNESGAFMWKADTPGDNLLATVQALPAVAGKAFPLARSRAAAPAPTTLPVTGGPALNLAWLLILSGLALGGGGYLLHRKK